MITSSKPVTNWNEVPLPSYDPDAVIRLTPEDLVAAVRCSRETAELWAPLLSGAAVHHGILSTKSVAAWLATIAHESAGLTRFEENLNYSASRLVEMWPHRFGVGGPLDPEEYARQPEKIANYVYDDANRAEPYKLGNTEPGDGWRFRGRGPIQITGRTNYTRCGRAIGVSLDRWPEDMLKPPIGAMAAGWFWVDRGLNRIADYASFEELVRKVAGGLTNIDDRRERLEDFEAVLDRYKA